MVSRYPRFSPGSDVDRSVRGWGFGWFDGGMVRLIFRFMLVPRACTVEQMKAMASQNPGSKGASSPNPRSGWGFVL